MEPESEMIFEMIPAMRFAFSLLEGEGHNAVAFAPGESRQLGSLQDWLGVGDGTQYPWSR